MSLSLRTVTFGLLLATAAITILSLSAQAGDPVAGTWELNLAKSKFNPGPPLQSQTRTFEVTEQQEKMMAKGIDAQGKPTLVQFTAQRDGKDYPFEGSPVIDTIALTPGDTFTLTYTAKKAGAVVITGTRVISKDGKGLTLSMKGTDAPGQPVESILVFDKR
jgi:hypothetical protein